MKIMDSIQAFKTRNVKLKMEKIKWNGRRLENCWQMLKAMENRWSLERKERKVTHSIWIKKSFQTYKWIASRLMSKWKRNFSIDAWIYNTPSVSLSIHSHPLKIKLAFETIWVNRFLYNLLSSYDILTLGSLCLKLSIQS